MAHDIREDIWEGNSEKQSNIGNPFLNPKEKDTESEYKPGWLVNGIYVYSADEWEEWYRPL